MDDIDKGTPPKEYRQDLEPYDPNYSGDKPWLLISILIAAALIAGAGHAFGWWTIPFR